MLILVVRSVAPREIVEIIEGLGLVIKIIAERAVPGGGNIVVKVLEEETNPVIGTYTVLLTMLFADGLVKLILVLNIYIYMLINSTALSII